MLDKFEQANAESQKKLNHYEQELHRYRALVSRLLRELKQPTK